MVWQNQILAGTSANQTSVESDVPWPDYAAWYRADTVTTSGTNVSQWDDKSGNGYHLIRWDASYSPQLISSDGNFNSKPSIDYTAQTGSNPYRFGTNGGTQGGTAMADIFSNGRDEFSIFCVWRAVTQSYSYSQMVGDWYGYLWLGPNSSSSLSIGNQDLVQSGSSVNTTFASHAWNGATSGSANLTLKTTGLTTAVHGSNETFSSVGASLISGGGSVASQYYDGYIAEILIYPVALTGSKATHTETYLADRYNLTW